jgi:sigma-E factor negative regulatory protein RseB
VLRLGGVAVVVLMLSSPAAQSATCDGAEEEALRWLDKMSRSHNQVSYHGVVTFQRGGDDMQVVQVAHSVAGDATSERLTQLTGQGAEVVRKDHPLDCIHPGHKLLRLGEELRSGQCGIADHYRFAVGDGERIAGRQSVRIRIEPRDMYRFGYVMELDRDTGLLLKTATLGRGSKVLELFQFADLSLDRAQPQDAATEVVHVAEHPMPGHAAPAARLSRPWAVAWLPGGFTGTDSASGLAGRRTFTDGLAVFSVFLEELDREIRPGEGVVQQGSTLSYTRGMRLADRPVLVTVVGEVPVNTARMVADSLRWDG